MKIEREIQKQNIFLNKNSLIVNCVFVLFLNEIAKFVPLLLKRVDVDCNQVPVQTGLDKNDQKLKSEIRVVLCNRGQAIKPDEKANRIEKTY